MIEQYLMYAAVPILMLAAGAIVLAYAKWSEWVDIQTKNETAFKAEYGVAMLRPYWEALREDFGGKFTAGILLGKLELKDVDRLALHYDDLFEYKPESMNYQEWWNEEPGEHSGRPW